MKTAFGTKGYEPREALQDPVVELYVQFRLAELFQKQGINPEGTHGLAEQCVRLAKQNASLFEYEREVYALVEEHRLVPQFLRRSVLEILQTRAGTVYGQVRPWLEEGSVLDLGCGEGEVGKLLAEEGRHVVLADIYTPPNARRTGLEFRLFRQGEPVPAQDNEFDNTLLLTVLHHSDDPLKTLREAYRVTRGSGKVVVIESVYGVKPRGLPREQENPEKSFLELDPVQQKMANCFFDHWYNRVIHYAGDPKEKVNVPYNFRTPEGWKRIFESVGFRQEQVAYLGIDLPIVPEYHTLHALRVVK